MDSTAAAEGQEIKNEHKRKAPCAPPSSATDVGHGRKRQPCASGMDKILDRMDKSQQKNKDQMEPFLQHLGSMASSAASMAPAQSVAFESMAGYFKVKKMSTIATVLEQYASLFDKGVLTKEEFEKKKQEILEDK